MAKVGGNSLAYVARIAVFNALFALFLATISAVSAAETVIVALGDSLTAGYGLTGGDAFPMQLERQLRRQGHDVKVRNAGVSGDTTAGGLARLGWAVPGRVDLVIVELGANDGLRGIDPTITARNLSAILERLGDRAIPVLLTGMRAPPNMGPGYGADFNAIFPRLADQYGVPLYPFFLEGVAARPELNLSDGLHPNADGVRVIVEKIAPYIVKVLARSRS